MTAIGYSHFSLQEYLKDQFPHHVAYLQHIYASALVQNQYVSTLHWVFQEAQAHLCGQCEPR